MATIDQTTPMLRAASVAHRLQRTDKTLDVESAEFQVVEQHLPAAMSRRGRGRLLAVSLSVMLATLALLAASSSSSLLTHAGETETAHGTSANVALAPPLPSVVAPLSPPAPGELAVTKPASEVSSETTTTPDSPAQRARAKRAPQRATKPNLNLERRSERRVEVVQKRSVRSRAVRPARSSNF